MNLFIEYLSLLAFSRIAKKERDACIERLFAFSMHA
jgi:hypothetical protein